MKSPFAQGSALREALPSRLHHQMFAKFVFAMFGHIFAMFGHMLALCGKRLAIVGQLFALLGPGAPKIGDLRGSVL